MHEIDKRVRYTTYISKRHKKFMEKEYERTGRTATQQLAEALDLLMKLVGETKP